MMTKLSWRAAALTDRGLKRLDNQDNLFISSDNRLFVVADGMGGAKDGAVASSLAVETVRNSWNSGDWKGSPKELEDWLVDSITRANNTIYGASGGHIDSPSRMGTTIVAAVHGDDDTLKVAHVGDSRAYLIRDKKVTRLTVDHSVVMEMCMRKQLTEEQAFSSIYRNLLTRCLGHNEDIEVDHTTITPRSGDWVILCSDGLNSVMQDNLIGKVVNRCKTPEEVCQKLLRETYDKEAPDNVTIVAIQYA